MKQIDPLDLSMFGPDDLKMFLPDGTLFSEEYERIVHGKRGSYIEFSKEQILLPLESNFGNTLPEKLPDPNFDKYYYWLTPGCDVKVYWQNKTVKYADYKVNYFYVSPSELRIE